MKNWETYRVSVDISTMTLVLRVSHKYNLETGTPEGFVIHKLRRGITWLGLVEQPEALEQVHFAVGTRL